MTNARRRWMQLVLAGSLACGCSGTLHVAPMIRRGQLLQACRLINDDDKYPKLSKSDLAALIVKQAKIEVRLHAISGAALRQMLHRDPFAARPAVDHRRRMLLALKLSYDPSANVRVTIERQPEVGSYSSDFHWLSLWRRSRFDKRPRSGPRRGLNPKLFGLRGLFDVLVKAGTLGAIDPNTRGSSQSLRQDLGGGRERSRPRERATPRHVRLLRRLTHNRCSETPSKGCRCAASGSNDECRPIWYFEKPPYYYRSSSRAVRLWLKIVVSRGGESCELEHGSIYAIEVPGKGNLPRRINALFAAGPRSLYQLGQDPPPGSRSKRGEAQRSAAAIALAKVPETCRAKCEILGQCARRKDPDNKYRDQCVALDAPSCAASYRCARFGACALSHSAKGRPICAATSASCRRASSCRRIGWCGLLAASRADSRAPLPARCAPTRTEHCAASRACRTNGECALVGSTCRPREASHCARSRHCAEYGWCSLSGGRCVAAATAQCKRSRRCRTWGSCRLDAKNGDCTR